ncbi:MAG TPA: TetR family transcriptional regulator [Amycolatopsis sp.]|nr:TetR family transcriptional regulator [Amycolatopsis sp.]
MQTRQPGLGRAARTEKTRTAIVTAALDLIAAAGYDATTTEAIAARAGVSPRTFFRYFPTKESVILSGEDDFYQAFRGVFRAQPDTLTDIAAMREALVTLAPGVARRRRWTQVYVRAVETSSALRGQDQIKHDVNTASMAQAIAERRALPEPDEDCELLAAIGHLLVSRALRKWAMGPARVSPAELLEAEFARLDKLLD